MKTLVRIRLVLFVLLVFGAFANFALNAWGDQLMFICNLGFAVSFFSEMLLIVVDRTRKQTGKAFTRVLLWTIILLLVLPCTIVVTVMLNLKPPDALLFAIPAILAVLALLALIDLFMNLKKENVPVFESFFLFTFFTGVVFRGLTWPGASLLITFGPVVFLLPYYIVRAIGFYRRNAGEGRLVITLFTLGYAATIILGFSTIMKIMHWPNSTPVMVTGLVLAVIMIAGSLKWNFTLSGRTVSLTEAMKMLPATLMLIFFLSFTTSAYIMLREWDVAPDFHSERYPQKFYRLRGLGNDSTYKKAIGIRNAFDELVEHAEEDGLLK